MPTMTEMTEFLMKHRDAYAQAAAAAIGVDVDTIHLLIYTGQISGTVRPLITP